MSPARFVALLVAAAVAAVSTSASAEVAEPGERPGAAAAAAPAARPSRLRWLLGGALGGDLGFESTLAAHELGHVGGAELARAQGHDVAVDYATSNIIGDGPIGKLVKGVGLLPDSHDFYYRDLFRPKGPITGGHVSLTAGPMSPYTDFLVSGGAIAMTLAAPVAATLLANDRPDSLGRRAGAVASSTFAVKHVVTQHHFSEMVPYLASKVGVIKLLAGALGVTATAVVTAPLAALSVGLLAHNVKRGVELVMKQRRRDEFERRMVGEPAYRASASRHWERYRIGLREQDRRALGDAGDLELAAVQARVAADGEAVRRLDDRPFLKRLSPTFRWRRRQLRKVAERSSGALDRFVAAHRKQERARARQATFALAARP